MKLYLGVEANMKNYKSAIGNAIIMWIVGICPIILPVIYYVICYVIDKEEIFLDIGMTIATFLGGLLVIFVMKKEYHVDIKEYLRKPDSKILLLVIMVSIFYVITGMYTLNRELLTGEADLDVISLVGFVLASSIVPIGEELTFRFGMLTLLLIMAKNSRFKAVFSIVLISILWMIMHCSTYVPRIFDIIIVGIIIGFIYLKTKNIIYCFVFHIVANGITYIFGAFYPWFLEREYILYISLPLFLISAVALIYRLGKTDGVKFVLNAE